nr:hypothetical protein [Rhizobium gallicum]
MTRIIRRRYDPSEAAPDHGKFNYCCVVPAGGVTGAGAALLSVGAAGVAGAGAGSELLVEAVVSGSVSGVLDHWVRAKAPIAINPTAAIHATQFLRR